MSLAYVWFVQPVCVCHVNVSDKASEQLHCLSMTLCNINPALKHINALSRRAAYKEQHTCVDH